MTAAEHAGLEFGIWDHFDRVPGVEPSRQFAERIAFVERAEQLGLFGYHLAEHHNSPLCMAPSPLLLLSALAARTSRIRLGTLVLLAPTYPLLRLLEEVSMLDELSQGRLALGLGPGVREIELVWLGADPAEAQADVQRAVDAIRRAFDEGMVLLPAAQGGEADSLFRYSSHRRPHPSLWWAGSLQRAAQQGMSVVGAVGPSFTRERVDEYWAAFDDAGDDGPWTERPRVGTTRHVVVAETDEEARAIVRRAWPVHADHVFEIPFGIGGETAVRGTAGMGVGEDADEVVARRTQLVAGSPATVREILGEYLDELGPGHDYLVGSFQWGDISHAEALRSLELYAAEVMPVLKDAAVAAPVAA